MFFVVIMWHWLHHFSDLLSFLMLVSSSLSSWTNTHLYTLVMLFQKYSIVSVWFMLLKWA